MKEVASAELFVVLAPVYKVFSFMCMCDGLGGSLL